MKRAIDNNSVNAANSNSALTGKSFKDYVIFSGGSLMIGDALTLHGKIGYNGKVSIGTPYFDNLSSTEKLDAHLGGWLDNVDKLRDAFIAENATFPVSYSCNKIKVDVYQDGENPRVTSDQRDKIIMVDGGTLTIGKNVTFDNVAIFVNGEIHVSGEGVIFKNGCYLVAQSDFIGNASRSFDFGDSVCISFTSFKMDGTVMLDGGAIYAEQDIKIAGSATIIYGRDAVEKNIKGVGDGAFDGSR